MLAALIIHAVWHIIVSRKLRQVRRVSRVEFWFGTLALAGVLLVDVLEGMIIGVVASLAFVIYRSSRPHISSLGRVPGVPAVYSDLIRHPENAAVPGVLILRLDGPMYYANARTVRDQIKTMLAATDPPPRAIIFDLAVQDDMDITSADAFKSLLRELRDKNIESYFVDMHAPVVEFSRRTGLYELISADALFRTSRPRSMRFKPEPIGIWR